MPVERGREIIPFGQEDMQIAVANPIEGLAASFRAEHELTDVQTTIEGIDDPKFRMRSYLDLAWGLHLSGGNPDPFIYQAYNSAGDYINKVTRDNFRSAGLHQGDKEDIFEMKLGVAELAAERNLPLAATALNESHDVVMEFECEEKPAGMTGKDLRTLEKLDSGQSRKYISEYILVTVPALIRIAALSSEHPNLGFDSKEIMARAEDIAWDTRVDGMWSAEGLAKCAELFLKFYIEKGDSESVRRVSDNIQKRAGGSYTRREDGDRTRQVLVRGKIWEAAFNRRLASSTNFEGLTQNDIDDVLVSGNIDAQKQLGRILSSGDANAILEREDVENDVKALIIEGLELKLLADEASARNTRLLLEAKRKEFKSNS